ncbi:hsp70-binding protein 1-like isoform X2 [Dermacentor albipictus]|uniref:hsp70-binding protein 1-like isoform X2 n=1 Tax=Dermacentor albipictus TaxID=60249 RepID=UPI0038FCEA05
MSGDDNPRNPNNLPALLNFCVRNTATEGAPSSSTASMDPERRKWLEEAMSEMTVSPVEEMQKNLNVIKETLSHHRESAEQAPTEEACCTLESALETITEYVGSIDYAKDFHKIGGFDVLEDLLCFPNSGVQSKACELVAELVQNSPYCQKQAAYSLKFLLQLVDATQEAVRLKALYAVSCLVRHNILVYLEFEKLDGFSVLLRALQSESPRLKTKAGFLLSSLCSQQGKSRDTLIRMGFVEQLAAMLRHEPGPHREHLLSTLDTLVSVCPSAREECRRPELQLEDTLRTGLASSHGREEQREEYDHSAHILATCFADSGTAGEHAEMDRVYGVAQTQVWHTWYHMARTPHRNGHFSPRENRYVHQGT